MVVEVDMDVPHNHCSACYDRNCQTSPQPGNACSLVNCEADCGARFHRCKMEEHQLLCPNVKTECVNAVYGCPVDVQRRMMYRHLEVCPASVVNCTMEWNRWPVYASERQPQQPLHLVPENYEQLDIALALRDQRMLTKSMKASKRTRQILTNALNRRHPAVPLTAQLTAYGALDAEEEQKELDNLLQTMQDEKEAADRERARTPPGLQRSICNELYRQSHDNNGVVASSGVPAYYPWPRDPFIHCSHCARRKERMERIMASHDAIQPENGAGAAEVNGAEAMDEDHNHKHHYDVGNMYSTPPHNHQNGLSHHGDPIHDGLYQSDAREDNVFTDHFMEMDGSHTGRIPSFNSTLSSEESEMRAPAVFVTQSTTGDVSTAPTRGHSKPIIIQPPAVTASALVGSSTAHRLSSSSNGSLDSKHSLSLDLSLESITRYQAKPDSMYTFLCAQEFRRDEYPYHFQNVHSDIHGGLNGWMEQRCPLAPYGCTFSQRRFYPEAKGARIIHSENLESFGLCLDVGPSTDVALDGGSDAEKTVEEEEKEREGATKFAKTEDVMPSSEGMQVVSEHSSEEGSSADRCPKVESSREGSSNEGPEGIDRPVSVRTGGDVTEDQSASNGPQTMQSSLSTDSSLCNDEGQKTSGETDAPEALNKEEGVLLDDTSSGNDNLQEGIHLVVDSPDVHNAEIETPVPDVHSNADIETPVPDVQRDADELSTVSESPKGDDHMSQLPFELLRYLLRFLDSFTLNHVAMTSKLLRQVCCSLLEERGMVVLQWEKHRGQWVTTMKVWHFSTAFTPVKRWGFESNPPIAEHLKHCPFNVRNISTEPVPVMRLDAAAINMASKKQKASAKLAQANSGENSSEKEGDNRDGLAFDVDVDVENW